jgi:bacterioferritin (cytochrome b1)
MVTKVGMQISFSSALQDLLALDYDAIEAYETAINKLENTNYKEKLTEFKADHERHIKEITTILGLHNEKIPTGPDAKQWLTKGKVILANLMGDEAILSAMKSNEGDTNTAYQRMNERDDIWEDAVEMLAKGWEDEKRHKAWLENILS